MDNNRLAQFLYFIDERQETYRRRFVEEEPPPWTDDRVLRRYHYCNVYRELDATTQYVMENVLVDADDVDVLFNVILFRLLNLPQSYEAIGGFTPADEFDVDHTVDTLQAIQAREDQVFSPAYRIPAHRWVDSDSKVENIFYGIIKQDLLENLSLYAAGVLDAGSMEVAHETLTEIRGIGGFLAYEFVTDLNYSLLPFHENDFVNVGPGAQVGIEHIWPNATDYEDHVYWLVENQERLFYEHDIKFFYWNGNREKRLTARDFEHATCEYSGYVRARRGEGGVRRFTPPEDTEQTGMNDYT